MPFEYDLRFAGHRSTVHNISAGPVDDLAVNVYDRAEGAGLRIAVDANPDLYDMADLATHQQGLLTLLREALSARGRTVRSAGPRTPSGRRPAARPGPIGAEPHSRPCRPARWLHRRRARWAEHHLRGIVRCRAAARAPPARPGMWVRREWWPWPCRAASTPSRRSSPCCCRGAAYCPLDPDAPASRGRTHCCDSAQPALVLTDSAHADGCAGRPTLVLDALEDAAEAPLAPAATANAPAYLISHLGLHRPAEGRGDQPRRTRHFVAGAAHRYGLRREDRVLQFAPLHFDASVEEVFLTLCTGATLVIRTAR